MKTMFSTMFSLAFRFRVDVKRAEHSICVLLVEGQKDGSQFVKDWQGILDEHKKANEIDDSTLEIMMTKLTALGWRIGMSAADCEVVLE